MRNKSQKQRVKEAVESLTVLEGGFKHIPENDLNPYRYASPNQQWGGLEDIDEAYIMRICNEMGYRCSQSNFGGIILRPKC